ncbi:hypothetical protein F511_41282 [Dorcoceras hygrometricum]|uniref:Uncharacterized protein n=1 Tax=Dorcoceras hygrometricum TaxID=472368 RepID=A0A2Z7BD47_9LAMI|nr:hypothetical protein F511_41282 [Dorcoceras hygrometricum]
MMYRSDPNLGSDTTVGEPRRIRITPPGCFSGLPFWQLVPGSDQYRKEIGTSRSTTIGKSRVAIDPIAMHTSWRSNSDIASVTRVSMTFRVVRTNQYNQDLGLIHSTNGNHLESPNEGSSIDHQVTIYLHAQNITIFPNNETWPIFDFHCAPGKWDPDPPTYANMGIMNPSTRSVLGKCVYLVTLAMSLFDLQDVCIAIGSIATLYLPMVVDLIEIYGLKGPYCTLTTTNWFLQALSVIPRGSWGDVARRSYHDPMGKSGIVIPEPHWLWPTASCIPEPLRVTQVLDSRFPHGY